MHEFHQRRTQVRAAHDELNATQAQLEQRLTRHMSNMAGQVSDLTQSRRELEAANRRLERMAAMDALTGIANRRHFDRVLEREVRRARRHGQPLSLIFVDLDEFKLFNDTYGHQRGDEILRVFAQTLHETFRRGSDLVARYGGEEFAVILPGIDARRAALYAERLRRRVWCLAIPHTANTHSGRLTLSAGVATLTADVDGGPDDVLQAADAALYRAKCQGRNCIASAPVKATISTGIAGVAS